MVFLCTAAWKDWLAIPQITEIVTTDTVYIPPEKRHPKLTVLSVAAVFGDAISRNYRRESISDLFVYGEELMPTPAETAVDDF